MCVVLCVLRVLCASVLCLFVFVCVLSGRTVAISKRVISMSLCVFARAFDVFLCVVGYGYHSHVDVRLQLSKHVSVVGYI